QAADQRADGAAPVQTGDLLDQAGWHAPPPVQAQGWVAGNPEQLLLQGAAQATGQLAQLALVELQADRLAEQGVEFAGQPAVQLVAAGQQLQQRLAQGGVGAFAAVGQQLLDRGLGIGQLFAALVQLELVEADVGDLVRQLPVLAHLRQAALLLQQDLRQQQAALERVDLFAQGLFALRQALQALAGAQVGLRQLIEAVGGAQQVVGQLQVAAGFAGQQAVRSGPLCLAADLGLGLGRLGQALLVDQRLQGEDFLLQARDALGQQFAATGAQVLEGVVAGQFAAQQVVGQGQRVQLGGQQVALLGDQRLAIEASL